MSIHEPEQAPAMLVIHNDFVRSLDQLANRAALLIGSVEALLRASKDIPPEARSEIERRVRQFREALGMRPRGSV